ncbi:MAG: class I SAM-dependent methyltransferase, partial [Firmicutes bacterium]|nr:class I SAM-dependent methyltransferase [Bacillota bacterium]
MSKRFYELVQADKVFDPWNEEWEQYSVERTLQWIENHEHNRFYEKYMEPSKKVLEAGCGLGRLVIYYRRKGYQITGIDKSETAIEKIHKFDPLIPVESGDLRALPYKDSSFDVYISEGVIEHDPGGPGVILKEALRVLKPGGTLLISIPVLSPFSSLAYSFRGIKQRVKIISGRIKNKPMKREFEGFLFSAAEFKKHIETAGFRIMELQPTLHAAGLYRFFPPARNSAIATQNAR